MTVTRALDGAIGRLTLDHPPVNILTRDVLARFRAGLAALAVEPGLRVLLLSAAGKHFSAGADVREHLPPEHTGLIPEFMDTIAALDAFPLPVIAAVQGRCLGGGFELVQAADIIVAGDGAVFGQPEILLGVIPPAACALLPTRVGRGVAAELVYGGDPLTAAEAARVGLVRRVVPDDQLAQATLAVAGRIARHSAATLRLAKRALRGGEAEASAAGLRERGELYLHSVMTTQDALEGLLAFVEKRSPAWADR
ncbi:MAG TPA: enoyl-CoA hydratase/isomerase family protein [Gemmatimonadales bacterium]|nr:enoyl-CoA hydratase/isomerase family protein [Gemmatimonadales bacterium]